MTVQTLEVDFCPDVGRFVCVQVAISPPNAIASGAIAFCVRERRGEEREKRKEN